MPTHKPTELSSIKLKTWTQQPVPMMSEHSAHLISLLIGFRIWLWRYTCFLLLILMLWHRQAILESKGDKLSYSAECRIRTWEVFVLCWSYWQQLRAIHLFVSTKQFHWLSDNQSIFQYQNTRIIKQVEKWHWRNGSIFISTRWSSLAKPKLVQITIPCAADDKMSSKWYFHFNFVIQSVTNILSKWQQLQWVCNY